MSDRRAAGAGGPGGPGGPYQWPAVSFARMRAGLRSALKTDCSGFKFQNGGMSSRDIAQSGGNQWVRCQVLASSHVAAFERSLAHSYGTRDGVLADILASSFFLEALDAAARLQFENVLRWVMDHLSAAQLIGDLDRYPDVVVLPAALRLDWHWFWDWLVDAETPCTRNAVGRVGMRAAARCGNLPMLEALMRERWHECVAEASRRTGTASGALVEEQVHLATCACLGGNVHLLSWLDRHLYQSQLPASTAGGGDENDDQDDQEDRENRAVAYCLGDDERLSSILERTAEQGELTMLEFLYTQHITHQRRQAVTEQDAGIVRTLANAACWHGGAEMVDGAINTGQFAVMEWLLRSTGAMCSEMSVPQAVASAHLPILRFLLEEENQLLDEDEVTEYVLSEMIAASRPTSLAMLEYLASRDLPVCTAWTLNSAATANNMRPDVLACLLSAAGEGDREQCRAMFGRALSDSDQIVVRERFLFAETFKSGQPALHRHDPI